MTFVEALYEAARRQGYDAERTAKRVREISTLIPEANLHQEIKPGFEEPMIEMLVSIGRQMRANPRGNSHFLKYMREKYSVVKN